MLTSHSSVAPANKNEELLAQTQKVCVSGFLTDLKNYRRP